MGLFSRAYEPGGEHHVRITDGVFAEALRLVSEDQQTLAHYQGLAQKEGLAKYEARDFPVSQILGAFLLAYELQERASGIPENLRIGNIELGRKDQVEFDKFVERYNAKIDAKAERAEEDKERFRKAGLGGALAMMAGKAAAAGVARLATGKSGDVRFFEKAWSNYLCGESPKAKEYLHKYVADFGAGDEAVQAVSSAIRNQFWIAEFARRNRAS